MKMFESHYLDAMNIPVSSKEVAEKSGFVYTEYDKDVTRICIKNIQEMSIFTYKTALIKFKGIIIGFPK